MAPAETVELLEDSFPECVRQSELAGTWKEVVARRWGPGLGLVGRNFFGSCCSFAGLDDFFGGRGCRQEGLRGLVAG